MKSYIINAIKSIGAWFINIITLTVGMIKFSLIVIKAGLFTKSFLNPVTITLIFRQIFFIGVELFFTTTITAMILGLAIVGTLSNILISLGATASIGSALTLVLVKIAAPFITGLILIFRTSSPVFVDIAMMKTNKDINTLKAMNLDIYELIFFPRIMASIISMFILSTYFIFLSIIGGFTLLSYQLNTTLTVVGRQVISSLELNDVGSFIFQVVFIGFIATAVPIYTAMEPKQSQLWLLKSLNRSMIRIFYLFIIIIFLGQLI